MTLKEKFLPRMYCFMGGGMLSNTYDKDVAEDNAKQCEDIVDEFAVEFGEWLLSRATGEEGLKLRDDILEIFKKEKGL
jgi:hypothetical protein